LAWLGGVAGAGGAVAAGAQKDGKGKHRWFYILSFVIAIMALLIIFSQA